MAPAVMADELMRDFQISGVLLGNLSAAYFYSYAMMQIPSGLLVGKIGPRRLSTYACLFSAAGVMVFAWGPNTLTTVLWGKFLFMQLPTILLYPLLAAIGFTSGALIIGFAFAREVNHPGAAGATGGVVNMSVLGIAAIMQPVLGRILDAHWDGTLLNGARIYDSTAYSSAFIWFPVSGVLAVAMVYLTRESYCRIREF